MLRCIRICVVLAFAVAAPSVATADRIVRPAPKGKFETVTVATDLPQQAYDLEGSTYVR